MKERQELEFEIPESVQGDCKKFTMRELDGKDDTQIALWVQANIPDALADDPISIMEQKQTEAMRCALVSVDGEDVNEHGVPFKVMDGWSHKTMRFVGAAFQRLNGIGGDDLKKFEASAKPVAKKSPKNVKAA